MDADFELVIVLNQIDPGSGNTSLDMYSLHQCLLMLFDSPLNHSNHLQVYIRLGLEKKLVQVHRETRIPRTLKRFSQLMRNFLKGELMPKVQTKTGITELLRFVDFNRFDDKQSKQVIKVRISNLAPKVRTPETLSALFNECKEGIIFVNFGLIDYNILGDHMHTEYEAKKVKPIVDNHIDGVQVMSISDYPISSAYSCVRICSAFETSLNVR